MKSSTQPVAETVSMFDPTFVTVSWTGLATGLFLGIILLSCVYSAAFYLVLKQRFLLWYAARGAAIVLLTITLSPLSMGPWFPVGSDARTMLGFLGFNLGVVLSGPFVAALVEDGKLPERLRKILFWSFPIGACFIPVNFIPDPPVLLYTGRLVVFLGILLLLIASLAVALRRRSRAAGFQTVAWSAVLALNLVNVPYHIVTNDPLPEYLGMLFVCLGFEFFVTAMGVADRFVILKRERDRAKTREELLLAMAETDPLTGIANRRGLERAFDSQIRAVALLDLDHFKRVNDTFGHDMGDKVLVHAAFALSSGEAVAARLGGEEFALLLGTENYIEEAEALRTAVTEEVAGIEGAPIVTASAGLVALHDGMDLQEALRRADKLVYEAKNSGRNQLRIIERGSTLPDLRIVA